jgi:hydrogenase nickel incorporation protein HypA/HybF
MHELGIATRIIDIVKKVREENGARKVGAVTVEIGQLAGVDRSSLEFCFDAITRGTDLEGARLVVDEKPPRARCRSCGAEYDVSLDDFRCKTCRSTEFDVLAGMDISIKEVEVE